MTRRIENPSKLSRAAIYTRISRTFSSAKNHSCIDCGLQALEYDHHLGYGENWDKVEPVCTSCHQKREFARGKYPKFRKQKKVGPLTKSGRFLSARAKELQRLEGVQKRASEKYKAFLEKFNGK